MSSLEGNVFRRAWRRLAAPRGPDEASDEPVVPSPAPKLRPLVSARGLILSRVTGGFFEEEVYKVDIPGAPGPGYWEMSGLVLEFDGHPPFGLAGDESGEGFKCVGSDLFWDGLVVVDLTDVAPFANVTRTRFKELTILTYSDPRFPQHVGIRLRFETGSLVLHNLWDFIETYDGERPEVFRPPFADAVLREHPWRG